MEYRLAVEIGGTKQQIAVGSEEGDIIDKRSVKLEMKRGSADILDWLSSNASSMIESAEYDVNKICVGFGGPFDTRTGSAVCSIQVPGWDNFSITKWFCDTFHKETLVLNDTAAGGMAELCKGAGSGSPCFFYTNIGTGIGGSLFIRKKFFNGTGRGAFYLGNTWVPDWTADRTDVNAGSDSSAGKSIRLEKICSGKSIEARLNLPGYVSDSKYLRTLNGALTCFDLENGVKAGDAFRIRELDAIADSFALGLANVLACSGADTIAVGGGVAKMGDILFDRIRAAMPKYEFIANAETYTIVPSTFMDDAVLVGALLSAKYLSYV